MISDIAFLRAENDKKPVDPPPYLISEYVQGHRVLPPNTPFPGFWDNAKTPYLIELMDNMSPFSPVFKTSVMKGAQIGVTAAAENIMGYWMQPNPAEVLYVSATDDLLEGWSAKRLDPLIDSIGMRGLITAQVDPTRSKSRRSGDKVLVKEYPGGTLNLASAQSAASLRSDSKRVLICDEVDGAPRLLKTGEGTWLDVAYARTNAWGARKKIFEFSTPTTEEDSLIREQYEAGDKRKYMVPCPHCGTKDELRFECLKHEMKDGQLFKVWYECPHCDGKIFNHQKSWMMDPANGAAWVPTAVAQQRGHRSYHISSLYSPVGMLSWYELYQNYLTAQTKPNGMRSFVNLYLGLPYKEKGHRPKADKLIEYRGEYLDARVTPEGNTIYDVPDGVLFISAGGDVQQGSGWNFEKNCPKDPDNQPRIEMEVLGHGVGHRTWSLGYFTFYGPINDPHSGAWEEMNKWAEKGGLSIKRSDGMQFPVRIVFIDSGDGNYTDVVYRFTERWKNTYPIKGFNALTIRKNEEKGKNKGDEAGPSNFRKYRAAKNEKSGDVTFYEISTNHYKSWTYSNLNIPRRDFGGQPPGFCHFPRDRAERYFLGLTAEEKRSDGSFHNSGKRNEPLDCRVYGLCAGDVWLDARVSLARAAAKSKKQDISPVELQKIDHSYVLELLRRQTARRLAA